MPEWLPRYRYAHRGLHGDPVVIPENSLAAFRAAAEAGYGIELDVQAAACGTPVVFHDFTLERLTARKGPLRALPARALTELPLAGGKETIPTLAQTLNTVGGRVPLLIEIKVPQRARIGRLEAEIALLLDDYAGHAAVQSFNPECVAWFADNAPGFIRGQIAQDFIADRADSMCWRQRLSWTKLWDSEICRPHFISYRIGDLPSSVTRAVRRARIPVITWTARTPQDVHKARQHADSFIFEGFRA